MGTAFFFVLGLCVGSFLNVVILRYGFSERAAERSACAQCGTTLHASDLVPVFSYFALGGRCRACGSALSAQYPIVELLVAALFAVTYATAPALLDMVSIVQLLSFLAFWAIMVAIVVYDIRHTLIPMPFLYALLVAALVHMAAAALVLQSYVPIIDAAIGALCAGGFFAIIHFVTRGRGMGIGDAYIGGVIGVMFGIGGGSVAAALGVWIGAAVGVIALALMKVFPRLRLVVGGTRVTLTAELPFAPFLALGALIVFLAPGLPASFGLQGLAQWLALSLF